ncbi:hypothetical protein Q7P36_009100 [Cladosporium allicinum]
MLKMALTLFSNGLWIPSTGWWNSANCLTVIADLAAIDDKVKGQALPIFENTLTQAQKYNLQMQKVVQGNYKPQSFYASAAAGGGPSPFPQGMAMPPPRRPGGFLNDYYDDEGWWVLAWIAAYDVTGNHKYLYTAQVIFDDMHKAYNTTPCGGLWWDKPHTYVNAIANELYIDAAAHLAGRSGDASQDYLNKALEAWDWFQKSGMINDDFLVNDGLTNACQNNNGTVWSYNQGVILGGLSELARVTNDDNYTTTAKLIADAAIDSLVDGGGILHDECEPNSCGEDGNQFKGVFARNLAILQQQSPEQRYADFLNINADSVWEEDRNDKNEFGVVWSGFSGTPSASTQSSGLDVIVAALSSTAGALLHSVTGNDIAKFENQMHVNECNTCDNSAVRGGVVTCGHPDVATGFPDDQNMLYQGENLTIEISATII